MELKEERKRFVSRQGEPSALIEQQSVARLEKELSRLREEELRRRALRYHELRDQLARERDRVLREIVPRRYALRGGVRVFPVAFELRLEEPES